MTGKYKFAGHVFEIDSLHEYFHDFAKEYRVPDETECQYFIRMVEEDILFEKRRCKVFGTEAGLEIIAVYRKICEKLAGNHVIMFHSSALSVDGKAYLFVAPSGGGKSTHARLWREQYGERVIMINDDKPLLKVDGEVTIFGTPWMGKHKLGANVSAPVEGVCVLRKGKENHIKRMGALDALPFLLNQAYPTEKDDAARKVMLAVMDLVKKIPIWELECNMDLEAARLAYETMSVREC